MRLQGQKELEAHNLRELRRLREQEQLLAQEAREKRAADLAKAARLCGRIFRHRQWVSLWYWARAAAAAHRPAVVHWVRREETAERLLSDNRAAAPGDLGLAACLGEAAAHGLLEPMREALAKVLARPQRRHPARFKLERGRTPPDRSTHISFIDFQ